MTKLRTSLLYLILALGVLLTASCKEPFNVIVTPPAESGVDEGDSGNEGSESGENDENNDGDGKDNKESGLAIRVKFVQKQGTDKYDFLWVFDNSASMRSVRQLAMEKLGDFVEILESRKAIDYQMAVATTDYFSNRGRLQANNEGLSVVTSASADPVRKFNSIVSGIEETRTSFWEQGLEASAQAIFKYGKKFMRKGVPLVLAYLTNEDDYSCRSNCGPPAPEVNPFWTPHPTGRYISFFKSTAEDGNEILYYPIVRMKGDSCREGSLGARYSKVQKALGTGKVQSICNKEVPDSFATIAKILRDRGACFELEVLAKADSFVVTVDGEAVEPSKEDGWEFDSENNAICFNGAAIPKLNQEIEIEYYKK